MRFYHLVFILLLLLSSVYSSGPSEIPIITISKQTLEDDIIQIQPGQILTVTFEPNLFDIYSIKLERIFQDGNIEGRVVSDYTRFEEEDIYDLGGCVSVQTQAQIVKISESRISSNETNSQITGIIHFEKKNMLIILTSNLSVLQYEIPLNQNREKQGRISKVFNFFDLIPYLSNSNEKLFGFTNNDIGFIVSTIGAWRLDLNLQPTSYLFDMNYFVKRNAIFDVFSHENSVFLACGEEGVDYYHIDQNNQFEYLGNINKILINKTQIDQQFLIEKVRVVNQGDQRILIFMEQEEGLHILKIENDHPIKVIHLYFIPIRHISSFDAVEFTIVATLSSKTYQSGLEIFFDQFKYYVNFFENDEFSIDSVVLDRDTRMGLWVGEDISKSFRHSIYSKNLLLNKTRYEDFIDLPEENKVFFLKQNNQKLMASVGRHKIELFNTTEIISKVVCSTKQKNFKGEYLVTFMSPFCNGETNVRKISADSLLKACQVSMRLVFSTSDALFDSSNIGFIIGGTSIFLLLIVGISFSYLRKYKQGALNIKKLKSSIEAKKRIDKMEYNKLND